MTIVALNGEKDSGKTNTINVLYTLLLNCGFTQSDNGKNFECLGNTEKEDFFDVLEKDNQKIGIVSLGDYPKKPAVCVKDLVKKLEAEGCSIVFCACTIKKNGENVLNSIQVKPENVVPKTKIVNVAQRRVDNYNSAKEMLEKAKIC